jgi:hypothetical protein
LNDNDGSEHDVYDVNKIYWDSDGNLRHGTTTRNRDDEIIKLLQADSHADDDYTKLWCVTSKQYFPYIPF